MARHGENIRKRADGRWEGRYKTYNEEKGRHVYRSVYGNTYAEVKEKLTVAKLTLQKNLLSGESKSPKPVFDNVRFSDVVQDWLREKRENCKYSTYIKYETVYRTHLSAALGACLLSEIESKVHPPEIFDHIFSENMSESLQKSICCVANQIFRYMDQKYGLRITPLKCSVMKTKKRTMETFTNSERLRLFSSIYNASACESKPDKYGIAVILCLHTGLRIGELCALRWEDINFKEMTLNVGRTVQRITMKDYATKGVLIGTTSKGATSEGATSEGTTSEGATSERATSKGVASEGVTSKGMKFERANPARAKQRKTALLEMEPKSESSRRTIPILAEIVKLLDNLNKDEPYVFGGSYPLEPRTLQYRFKKMLDKAKIDCRNFHMLRHTFATSCIESGMDVKSLCEILGHSDVKITMNRYVHPTMDSKRKQMESLAGFYGQIHGQVA